MWKSAQKVSEERHRVVGELRRQNEKARVDADRGVRGARGSTTECARQPELGAIFLPRSRPEHGPAGTTEREGFSFISFSLGFCACVSGVEALSVKVEIRVSCPCVGRPR